MSALIAAIKIDPGVEAMRAEWNSGWHAGLTIGLVIGLAAGMAVAALLGRWLRT
jgi:hypothetical protein